MISLNTLFKNSDYFELALIHRSFPFKNKKIDKIGHNERLEFLGDSILGFIVADQLMRLFPEAEEGVLSQMRSSLVSEEALADIAKHLGLNEELKLSFQEERNGGREKSRILGSAFEALVGALFLDSGFEVTQKFIMQVYKERWPENHELRQGWDRDFKTQLQEISQKQAQKLPQYKVISESGPDHDKEFKVEVEVMQLKFIGTAKSKKQAEQEAAKKALFSLNQNEKTNEVKPSVEEEKWIN